MRNGRSKERILAYHIGIYVVILLVVNVTPGYSININQDNEQQKSLLETIRRSSDLPINIDNSEHPPLLIQAANAKRTTGAEYEGLTGSRPASSYYISCPSVKLVNNTDKRVTAFFLGLFNRSSGDLEVLKINRRVEPLKEFIVEPVDWASPRAAGVKKLIMGEGAAQEDKSLPDFSSEIMWFPGHITDFQVLITRVEFEDGSKWTIKR